MAYMLLAYPHPGLVDNPRWLELMDETIRCMNEGGRVLGTRAGLLVQRNFTRFECHPLGRASVYPNGDLWYPCTVLQKKGGNLLECGDFNRAVKIGQEKHGPVPHCDNRCHANCYVEPSIMAAHPLGVIGDLVRLALRRKSRGAPRRPPRAETLPPLPTRNDLRVLPNLSPDRVRELRARGGLENDFTSWIKIV